MRIRALAFFLAATAAGYCAPFDLTLGGVPVIHLTLDREYAVLEHAPAPGEAKQDARAIMFVPADKQSSAMLAMGRDVHPKSEAVIAQMYPGAEIVKVAGKINDKAVQWWHYHDAHHLYSSCTATLADKKGTERLVVVELAANSQERLAAIEAAFAKIGLE